MPPTLPLLSSSKPTEETIIVLDDDDFNSNPSKKQVIVLDDDDDYFEAKQSYVDLMSSDDDMSPGDGDNNSGGGGDGDNNAADDIGGDGDNGGNDNSISDGDGNIAPPGDDGHNSNNNAADDISGDGDNGGGDNSNSADGAPSDDDGISSDGAPWDDEEIISPDENDDHASSVAANNRTRRKRPRAYNTWSWEDKLLLVRTDGKLLKENPSSTVSASMLFEELQKADPPLTRANVDVRSIGQQRSNLEKKFYKRVKEGGKRVFRGPRKLFEAQFYTCGQEAWPHIKRDGEGQS